MPGFFYVYRIYIKYIYSPFFARFAADHGRAIVLFVTRRAYPDLKHISEDNLIPKDNDYQSTVIRGGGSMTDFLPNLNNEYWMLG